MKKFNWMVDELKPDLTPRKKMYKVVMHEWVDEGCCCGQCGSYQPLPMDEWWVDSYYINKDGMPIRHMVDMSILNELEN